MVDNSSPTVPKWLHQWFWLWEDLVRGPYRVAAVATAAGATASVLAKLTPLRWGYSAPVSLAAWIGLAIAQEHDEQVTLPIDKDFLEALHTYVTPVVAPAGFSFSYTNPTNRARGGPETFVYEAERQNEDVEIIWIYRDREIRTLGISTWAPFDGPHTVVSQEIADRFQTLVDPVDDAQAIASALALWMDDKSIRFPQARSASDARKLKLFGRRSSDWFEYAPR